MFIAYSVFKLHISSKAIVPCSALRLFPNLRDKTKFREKEFCVSSAFPHKGGAHIGRISPPA
jgi:hypothetical protein